MDTTHDYRHLALAKSICNLIGPGSAVSVSGKAYKVYILVEINGFHTLIGNGYLDILGGVCGDHAEIERWRVGLCPPRKEPLLEKGDIGRIRGVIWIDQLNSHVSPLAWVLSLDKEQGRSSKLIMPVRSANRVLAAQTISHTHKGIRW